MRRGSKPSIIKREDGMVLGVCLSADFCAEHEWGIEGINRAFGRLTDLPKLFGVERRKITKLPAKGFYWHASKEYSGIVYWETWGGKRRDPIETREINFRQGTLAAAWDEKSFAVVSSDPEEIKALFDIYESFDEAQDGVIFLGGRQTLIGNPGLCLAIASRLPKELTDGWYAADKEAYEVQQEMAATNIEDILKSAGKKYFALSPRRRGGKLIFWLNPYEQQQNNTGWFTLEDLRDWAKGKGKIPKSGK